MEKMSGAQRRLRKKVAEMKRKGEAELAGYVARRVDLALHESERIAAAGAGRRIFEAVDQLRRSLRTVNEIAGEPGVARLSSSGLAVARAFAAKAVSDVYGLRDGRP